MFIILAESANNYFFNGNITKNVDPDIECSFAVKFVCCITTFFLKLTIF